MKIHIAHSQTKRTIDGQFEICGTKAELINIAEQILEATRHDFSYGWVSIYDQLTKACFSNCPPKPWD